MPSTRTITTTNGNLTITPSTNITVFGTTISVNNSTRTIASTGTLDISSAGALGITTSAGDVSITPFTNIVNFGSTLRASVLGGDPTLTALTTQSLILATAGSGSVNITPGSTGSVGITTTGATGGNITLSTAASTLGTIALTSSTTVGVTATLGNATVTTTNGNINLVTTANNTSIVMGSVDPLLTITPYNTITNTLISATKSLTIDSQLGAVNISASNGTTTVSGSSGLTLSTTSGNVLINPGSDITSFGAGNVTINDSTRTITGSTTMSVASTSGDVLIIPSTRLTKFGATPGIIIDDNTKNISGTTSLTISTTTATPGGITIAPVSTAPIALNATGAGGTITLSTSANAANINLTPFGTSIVSIVGSTASTSSGTGTVVISGTGAGLGVDGAIFSGGLITSGVSLNAPVVANGSVASSDITIRGNTADASGKVILHSNMTKFGPSTNARHVGIYTGSGTHVQTSIRDVFTVTIPNDSKFYVTADVAITDCADVSLFSTKILAIATGSVVTIIQQFEAITDTNLFAWDVTAANSFKLTYDPTNGTTTNVMIQYLSASSHDVTSIVVNTTA